MSKTTGGTSTIKRDLLAWRDAAINPSNNPRGKTFI